MKVCRELHEFNLLIIKEKSEEEKFQNHINFIMDVQMLRGVPFNVARRIYFLTDIRVCKFNEVIYKEGDPAEGFFMIRKGQFEVAIYS